MYSSPGFKGSPGRDERGWIAERRERVERRARGRNTLLMPPNS